jgi:ubiquinone/menaquinone biosynthesis C-methylase UbiE
MGSAGATEARSVSELEAEPGGNVYDKYRTANPIERRLVSGFIYQLLELTEHTGARDAHEVGCGEGELARRLAARGVRVRGTDASPEVIAEAQRRAMAAGVEVEFRAAQVERLDPAADAAELVVCCEVLEHLPDPEAGLATVARLANPWAIVSVPREPLWRALNVARLKYLRDLGNTPGHLNHWSRRGFLRFLGRQLEVVDVRSPLPWTMALCRAPGPRIPRS